MGVQILIFMQIAAVILQFTIFFSRMWDWDSPVYAGQRLVFSWTPYPLTIEKPQHDQSVTKLQFFVENNRWINEYQPKETRSGFKKSKNWWLHGLVKKMLGPENNNLNVKQSTKSHKDHQTPNQFNSI